MLFVLAKALVISPFAFIKTTGDFKHIQITDVGDYYKHTFVVSMLKLDGIPPGHPYFPEAKLSYYFGYYLIPASLSRLFNFAPNQVFYFYSLITDLLGLLIILRIFQKYLKTYIGKVVAIPLLITGVGVNVFSNNGAFQLINNYKALLFVPQHFFAACLTIGLLHYLIFDSDLIGVEKPKIWVTGILIAFILLSSIFVSWTLIVWLALAFYCYKQIRIFLILSGILSLILSGGSLE